MNPSKSKAELLAEAFAYKPSALSDADAFAGLSNQFHENVISKEMRR